MAKARRNMGVNATVQLAIEKSRSEFGREVKEQLEELRRELQTDLNAKVERTKISTDEALRQMGSRLDGIVSTMENRLEEHYAKISKAMGELKGEVSGCMNEHSTILEGKPGDKADTGLKGAVASQQAETNTLRKLVIGEDGDGGILKRQNTHDLYWKIAIGLGGLVGVPLAAAVVYLVLHALGAHVPSP